MRGVSKLDVVVATSFVLAALVEAVAVHRSDTAMLAFSVCGAPVLAVLAVRRTRPLVTLGLVVAFAVLGTLVQTAQGPEGQDSGGVWLFAMLLASYSLGAHARGRVVVAGGIGPLLVVLTADLPTMTGWPLVSGILFVTLFVGVLPTVVGRLVRVRRDRLVLLADQRALIAHEQRAATEAAVRAERLRASERLQPSLLAGMRSLAEAAESGAEPEVVESAARDLLARTREEVVALTAPVEASPPTVPLVVDHVEVLREAAQPWAVLVGGALACGLALESLWTLHLAAPEAVAVAAGLLVGASLAFVWWRPLASVVAGWTCVVLFSQTVAPLDGDLGESAFALCAAFAVGALSRRPTAGVGLAVCWLGQALVGPADPLGEAAIVLVCWLGGLAVNEATRLVEQGRAYNHLLTGRDEAATRRGVVDERLRLARELHDQIGHSLTVVALQAGAARRLAASDPDLARSLLLTVATAARDGVAAMDGTEGSGDLTSLLELTRTAGLPVEADVEAWDSLDSDGRTTVHRLVQEALTNVLRHAPGATARVVVRRAGEGVEVVVANTAPAHRGGDHGTGQGLTGIRARVAARSGQVSWGPRPGGGFEVRAMLPSTLEAAAP